MTHNHSTRAFAQLTIDAFIRHLQSSPNLSSLLLQDHFQTNDHLHIWPMIKSYLMDNKEFDRLKRGLGNSLDQLQGYRCQDWTTPQSVFAPPKGPDASRGFDEVPESLIENVFEFLAKERNKVREANDTAIVAKETGSQISHASKAACDVTAQKANVHAINVQRKITTSDRLASIYGGEISTPWMLTMDAIGRSKQAVFDFEDRLKSRPAKNSDASSLIVVASLIDKVPNLAGLTRTCEVFKADKLIISDTTVMRQSAFKSISVTAEDWIPIEEVKSVALGVWLMNRKHEGYALIGLEQTSRSMPLSKYAYPKKCVLILGREKEGLPAELLSLMDATVEIPQLGVIRSLNVHVSGALAIYEYTKQHRLDVDSECGR